jgi:hypothetical protein
MMTDLLQTYKKQATERFFDDHTKVCFDLQEGRRVLRSLQSR